MPENNQIKDLRSELLAGVRVWTDVLNKKYLIAHIPERPLKGQFVLRLRATLAIVIPEMDKASREVKLKAMCLHNEDINCPNDNDQTGLRALDLKQKVYDEQLALWVTEFQQLYNISVNEEDIIKVDGIMGNETIDALDRALTKIAYYRYDLKAGTAKTIHNAAKAYWVGKYTVVYQEGAMLLTEPLPTAKPLRSTPLSIKTRVLLKQIIREGESGLRGWGFVSVDGPDETGAIVEQSGYVNLDNIWTRSRMPEPFAELYKLKSGDRVEDIINERYMIESNRTGEDNDLDRQDRRYYANVLLFINNPTEGKKKFLYGLKFVEPIPIPTNVQVEFGGENHKRAIYAYKRVVDASIYVDQRNGNEQPKEPREYWESHYNQEDEQPYYERGIFGARHIYNDIKYQYDHHIWLPSKTFADSLRNLVDSGSYTGGLLTDARQIIDKFESNINALAKSTFKRVQETLNKYWPVGMGIKLDAAVGATFGIPVGLDANAYFYIWRDDDNTIKVIRRGVVGGGLDTGIGLGAFMGYGKTPTKYRTTENEKNWGIGAELAVSLQTGVRLLMHQELTFPLDSDLALAILFGMLASQVAVFSLSSLAAAIPLTMEFFNLDPNDYMSHLILQAGVYANGAFTASAGIRYGKKDETEIWTNQERKTSFTKGQGHVLNFLANWSTFGLDLTSGAEINAGIEYKVPEPKKVYIDEISGNRIPLKCEWNLFFEGSVENSLPLPLPSGGGGVKASFTYVFDEAQFQPGGTGPVFSNFQLIPYKKSGELDIYAGTASEIQFIFDPNIRKLIGETGPYFPTKIGEYIQKLFASDTSRLVNTRHLVRNMFTEAKFTWRIGLSNALGQRGAFKSFTQRMQTMKVLIGDNQRVKGWTFAGYLNIEYKPPQDLITKKMWDFLGTQYDDLTAALQEESLEKSLAKLFAELTTGEKLSDLLRELIEEDLSKSLIATLHFELGKGTGLSLRAGAGAKVRGLISVGGAILYRHRLDFQDLFYLLLPALKDDKEDLKKPPASIDVSKYWQDVMTFLVQNASPPQPTNTP